MKTLRQNEIKHLPYTCIIYYLPIRKLFEEFIGEFPPLLCTSTLSEKNFHFLTKENEWKQIHRHSYIYIHHRRKTYAETCILICILCIWMQIEKYNLESNCYLSPIAYQK